MIIYKKKKANKYGRFHTYSLVHLHFTFKISSWFLLNMAIDWNTGIP